MAVKNRILDGKGKGFEAEVSSHHGLSVSEIFPDLPDTGTKNRYRFYRALLGSTGADSGTTNMNVNGSVTAQEFYIGSHADYDIHIMGIAIVIADDSVVHNRFGNISTTTVTSGWDLYLIESDETTYLVENARTSGEVLFQSGFFNAYGDAASTWELTNWGPLTTDANDATTIYLPIATWVPVGVRLGRGTDDKLVSVVNDDLTGLTEFYCRVFGFAHYP